MNKRIEIESEARGKQIAERFFVLPRKWTFHNALIYVFWLKTQDFADH